MGLAVGTKAPSPGGWARVSSAGARLPTSGSVHSTWKGREKCENRENPGWELEATVASLHRKTQDVCLRFLHRGPFGPNGCPTPCVLTEGDYLARTPTELHYCSRGGECLGRWPGALGGRRAHVDPATTGPAENGNSHKRQAPKQIQARQPSGRGELLGGRAYSSAWLGEQWHKASLENPPAFCVSFCLHLKHCLVTESIT